MKQHSFLISFGSNWRNLVPLLWFALPLLAQAQRPENQTHLQHLRNEARQLQERHVRAMARFDQSLQSIQTSQNHQTRLEDSTNRAAARCAEFSTAIRLIRLVATDTLRGGESAPVYLQTLVREDIHTWSDPFHGELREAILVFEREVGEIQRNAAYAFAQALREHPDTPVQNPAESAPLHVDSSLRTLGISSVFVGGGIAFDVVTVGRTRLWATLPETLARVTWSVFRGKARQAGAAVTAGMVDGPGPIGSVLTVAGLVWTFHDIHATLSQFERDLSTEIRSGLSRQRDQSILQTREAAQAWIRQQRQELDRMVRNAGVITEPQPGERR